MEKTLLKNKRQFLKTQQHQLYLLQIGHLQDLGRLPQMPILELPQLDQIMPLVIALIKIEHFS